MKQNWNYPTKIKFGVGRLEELASSCQELQIRSPLLVVDPGLLLKPMMNQVGKYLPTNIFRTAIFSDFKSNPTEKNVCDGVVVFHNGKHDGIIAIGGGSALDNAKAVALMSAQELSLWAFEDHGDNWIKADS